MSVSPDLSTNLSSEKLLDHLLARADGPANRLTSLLKPHNNKDRHDWAMFCPSCFNSSLDIKLTQRVGMPGKGLVWTQGRSFAFSVGDTIYDTPDAYLPWKEAITKINVCLRVKNAAEAAPGSLGEVVYDRFAPKGSKLVYLSTNKTTQVEFVRFLINGDSSQHEVIAAVQRAG